MSDGEMLKTLRGEMVLLTDVETAPPAGIGKSAGYCRADVISSLFLSLSESRILHNWSRSTKGDILKCDDDGESDDSSRSILLVAG